jgi:single-strand DNA-binding protein
MARMSKDLNKWMGIGRTGKDPEIRYTKSGTTCASFSMACGDDYKDKNTGEKVEKTEWINISAFGGLADIIGKYVRKGAKIYIEGKYTTRKWQDQSGQDRYTTEIIASDMQMLDSREGGQAPQNQGYQQPQQQAPQQGNGAPTAPHQQQPVQNGAAPYQQNASAPNAAQSHSSGHQQQGYANPQAQANVPQGHQNRNPPPQGMDFSDDIPF